MSILTVQTGKQAAIQMVKSKQKSFDEAKSLLGNRMIPFKSDCPMGLCIAHLLLVNPGLKEKLPITKDRRRGFMLVTQETACRFNVSWERVDQPKPCAFLWGTEINNLASTIYTNNTSLFTKPDADFWGVVYIAHRLGLPQFKALWTVRDTTKTTVMDSLLYAVERMSRGLPGISATALKKLVLVDCVYAQAMISKLGSSSTGWGRQPPVSAQDWSDIYG